MTDYTTPADGDEWSAVDDGEFESPVMNLVAKGLTPAQAVDYHATITVGLTQEEWADRRDLGRHQSVGRNARAAEEKLGVAGGSFAEIVGETEVEFQCGVAANDEFDESDPEFCDHEPETVTLDEPAYIDDKGNLHLPGRPSECPECGNPVEFEFNGVPLFFS